MHSYETVAVLALAVSAASPALSAPVVEARAGVAAPGGVGSLIKTIGTGIGFGALPVILQDALGGNTTRREEGAGVGNLINGHLPDDLTPDARRGFLEDFFFNSLPVPDNTPDTRRDLPARIIVDGLPVPDNSGDDSSDTTPARIVFDGLPVKRNVDIRALFDGLLTPPLTTPKMTGPILNAFQNTVALGKRAISFGDVGKTLAGTLASLAAADGVKELLTRGDTSSRELIDALQLVSRHLDEHAARGVVSSVLNGLKNTDTIGNVIKNGLISGVASGVGAVGATELLNNTRREPEPQAESLLSVISLLARELEELD